MIKIDQSASQIGPRHWKWAVWLSGDPKELDEVGHVVYYLHPTFRNPVRKISSRKTQFRLDESGCGTFTLGVKIYRKDGRVESLYHKLTFADAPSSDTQKSHSSSNRSVVKRVLLLSDSTSSDQAAELTEQLESEGVEVTPASAVEGGAWSKELIDRIREVDLVVSIGEAHEFGYEGEAAAAKKLGKLVVKDLKKNI